MKGGKKKKEKEEHVLEKEVPQNAYFPPGTAKKEMVPQPPATRGSTNFAQFQITKCFINGTCSNFAMNGNFYNPQIILSTKP